ncbi:hypothetical protein BD413DRAFT_184466 [Trametes elegans]|nr:hypothetical protein BD413DRAFT_184466 [Trametes elegans]
MKRLHTYQSNTNNRYRYSYRITRTPSLLPIPPPAARGSWANHPSYTSPKGMSVHALLSPATVAAQQHHNRVHLVPRFSSLRLLFFVGTLQVESHVTRATRTVPPARPAGVQPRGGHGTPARLAEPSRRKAERRKKIQQSTGGDSGVLGTSVHSGTGRPRNVT